MITHDIGNFFWGIDDTRGKLLKNITTVHESSYPYRYCPSARISRILPGKSVVFGRWVKRNIPVYEHLLEALRGRELEVQD